MCVCVCVCVRVCVCVCVCVYMSSPVNVNGQSLDKVIHQPLDDQLVSCKENIHLKLQFVLQVQCTSYNTPTLNRATGQKIRSPSLQNYDINSLSEDDSTDDEEDPAQEIPGWAKGTNFKRAILAQIHSKMDPREIFINMLDPPKLEKMFPKLRARFFKRTSSACWDHPPRPFNTMLH